MKKSFTKILTLLAAIFCSSLFFSCKDSMLGYSVVLWGLPEYNIQDCEVVPVYIKSNINHVYVIGTPDNEKIEVPFWRITEPVKKNKVEKEIEKYKAFEHQYASVKKDGLPCRAEQVNTAKQVYRLRKGEMVKVLYQGNPLTITDGKKTLEGFWYRVLTNNGTTGWSFSANLSLLTLDAEGKIIGGEEFVEEEVVGEVKFEELIDKNWYPHIYNKMLAGKNVDTTILSTSFMFKIDTEKNIVTLNYPQSKDKDIPAIYETWNFEGYTPQGTKNYSLNNIPVTLVVKRPDFIVVHYLDKAGKPIDLDYAIIDEDKLANTIAKEKNKRYANFRNVYRNGPYISENYGRLTVRSDYSFTWTGYDALIGSVIGSYAKTTGTISTRYGLDKKFGSTYDGVLAFKFSGQKDEILFLYSNEEDGIRLEDASGAKLEEGILVSTGLSPTVIFFGKEVERVDLDADFESDELE